MIFGKYTFEGPYPAARYLFDKPAVVAILCHDIRETSKFYLIDVDESDKARTRIQDHPNMVKWAKACHGIGKLALAVMYAEKMTQSERKKIVEELKVLYNTPVK